MIEFAVNGTLMRGLELNRNLQKVGATFVREDITAPMYRLWSIRDRHPAMLRVSENGQEITLEIWSITPAALGEILLSEPAGLCIGKIILANQQEVLGVLGEPFLCEGQKEITSYGGWRSYIASQ
ncbi:MAG: glutamyl-tRNA amidotransferase [Pseudanabaena sp.]